MFSQQIISLSNSILYTQININLSRYVSFSTEELNTFNTLLKHKEVSKRTFLLRAGEICNFEAFVVKGCLRKYYIDETGQEVIIQFAIENSWISDIASFSEQKASNMFVETLEDCELFILTPQTKEELLSKVPRFERFYRILLERSVSVLQNRLHFTIAKTAQEKYVDFLEQYPTIPQRVAQHYIASFLGISPEFLSKVRAKMAKQ